MKKQELRVALVGIGGYGNHYLAHLFQGAEEANVRFVGAIDPSPNHCRYLWELQAAGIPRYASLEEFYTVSSADLVVITAPIHFHAPLTYLALAHNADVLCEKPVAATIQDAERMATTAEQTGKFVAVGYQWSFSDAIQALKQDILAGTLGRPVRLKTKVFWPRPISYFQRAAWAGKLRTADGQWILDSPAHNATGHYLHNMLYVLGDSRETSAWPVDVQAELYRANDIENFDAAAIRCHTRNGVEILFYTAHCVPNRIGPVFSYEFEHAVVEFEQENGDTIIARFHDDRVKEYGDPNAITRHKLWQAADAMRTGTLVVCDVKTAMPQLVCLNGAQESMPEITPLPQNLLKTSNQSEDPLVWMEGLQESFERCYERGQLPSENADVSWGKGGEKIDLRHYHIFPSLTLPDAMK